MRSFLLVAVWLALLGAKVILPSTALAQASRGRLGDDPPAPAATAPSAAPATGGAGSLSGLVYFDANANGRPDAQERAVRNVQIDLTGPGYQESRKTIDNGTYEFTNLAPGRYVLAVRLPTGYGLSDGYDGEILVDGRSAQKDVNFGIARSDQLAALPPRPTRTPLPLVQSAPAVSSPAQPAPPFASASASSAGSSGSGASRLPPVATAPGQLASTPTPSGSGAGALAGSGTSSSGGSGLPPGRSSPSGSSAAGQDSPVRPPDPPLVPTPEPTAKPTATIVPTPTRTPLPVESQQAASERAQAALASPGQPRIGSQRSGEDVLLDVPFRTALDGTHYADTNSGSAAIGMALDAYGFNPTTPDLRALANVLGRSYDWNQPPAIFYLVRVAEQSGLRALGLYQGSRPAVWTIDDVRTRVRAGYPVLTMIRPPDASGPGEQGREHDILIVGVQNNNLIYHDPTYPDDRSGARRTMTPDQLNRAWAGSPESSQAAAFSLGKNELGLFAPVNDLVQAQQQVERPTPTPIASPEAQPALEFATPGPRPLEANQPATPPVEPSPSGGLPLHPLLLAFIVTAGVMFFKVTAKLLSD